MISGDHYCGAKCAWLHWIQGEIPSSVLPSLPSLSSLPLPSLPSLLPLPSSSSSWHHGDFGGDCHKWWPERIFVDPGEKPWCGPSVQIPGGVLQRVNWPGIYPTNHMAGITNHMAGLVGFEHCGPWREDLTMTTTENLSKTEVLLVHFLGGETLWDIYFCEPQPVYKWTVMNKNVFLIILEDKLLNCCYWTNHVK